MREGATCLFISSHKSLANTCNPPSTGMNLKSSNYENNMFGWEKDIKESKKPKEL